MSYKKNFAERVEARYELNKLEERCNVMGNLNNCLTTLLKNLKGKTTETISKSMNSMNNEKIQTVNNAAVATPTYSHETTGMTLNSNKSHKIQLTETLRTLPLTGAMLAAMPIKESCVVHSIVDGDVSTNYEGSKSKDIHVIARKNKTNEKETHDRPSRYDGSNKEELSQKIDGLLVEVEEHRARSLEVEAAIDFHPTATAAKIRKARFKELRKLAKFHPDEESMTAIKAEKIAQQALLEATNTSNTNIDDAPLTSTQAPSADICSNYAKSASDSSVKNENSVVKVEANDSLKFNDTASKNENSYSADAGANQLDALSRIPELLKSIKENLSSFQEISPALKTAVRRSSVSSAMQFTATANRQQALLEATKKSETNFNDAPLTSTQADNADLCSNYAKSASDSSVKNENSVVKVEANDSLKLNETASKNENSYSADMGANRLDGLEENSELLKSINENLLNFQKMSLALKTAARPSSVSSEMPSEATANLENSSNIGTKEAKAKLELPESKVNAETSLCNDILNFQSNTALHLGNAFDLATKSYCTQTEDDLVNNFPKTTGNSEKSSNFHRRNKTFPETKKRNSALSYEYFPETMSSMQEKGSPCSNAAETPDSTVYLKNAMRLAAKTCSRRSDPNFCKKFTTMFPNATLKDQDEYKIEDRSPDTQTTPDHGCDFFKISPNKRHHLENALQINERIADDQTTPDLTCDYFKTPTNERPNFENAYNTQEMPSYDKEDIYDDSFANAPDTSVLYENKMRFVSKSYRIETGVRTCGTFPISSCNAVFSDENQLKLTSQLRCAKAHVNICVHINKNTTHPAAYQSEPCNELVQPCDECLNTTSPSCPFYENVETFESLTTASTALGTTNYNGFAYSASQTKVSSTFLSQQMTTPCSYCCRGISIESLYSSFKTQLLILKNEYFYNPNDVKGSHVKNPNKIMLTTVEAERIFRSFRNRISECEFDVTKLKTLYVFQKSFLKYAKNDREACECIRLLDVHFQKLLVEFMSKDSDEYNQWIGDMSYSSNIWQAFDCFEQRFKATFSVP